MPADRDQTRPAATVKPSKSGYHDPVYDAPTDSAPVDDNDIKKRIGADQPIPSYKYKDAEKDKAISDKLEKQDRAKQKLPPGRSKPNKAPKPGTNTSSSEFDKIRGIESGNRDYDDYSRPIVSPKGARYAAQVMPKTNANPGYGVKPAADAGPEESNRVGQDYFNAMKNKYGNSELAAAAYNAGPGRLDKILQKAKETGRHWKDLLPAETQNYIKKFTGK
jgi:soluble lytic murein transglycosylase-like protein